MGGFNFTSTVRPRWARRGFTFCFPPRRQNRIHGNPGCSHRALPSLNKWSLHRSRNRKGPVRSALLGGAAARNLPCAIPVSSLPTWLTACAGFCPRRSRVLGLLLPCIATDAATTACHVTCAMHTFSVLHHDLVGSAWQGPYTAGGRCGTVTVRQKYGGPASPGEPRSSQNSYRT